MKFRLYREYGALNSPPVFNAFEQGLKNIGCSATNDTDSIPVIWSVLWNGRMKPNQQIYAKSLLKNIPIVIVEVGNFFRGVTWRISINNVNRLGLFGEGNIDPDRPKKLGLHLLPFNSARSPEILIACQHKNSLQWPVGLSLEEWVTNTVLEVKKFTDRRIVVRPHPRCLFNVINQNVKIEIPKKVSNSYDNYDLRHDYHAVINFNTGPSITAAINGTPVICDHSSLAYPVSDKIENIENPKLFDRDDWLINLSHHEWTLEEIAAGIPQSRLLSYL